MKNVNIVTFQNACNYGAILQCLGLQNYLQLNNYDVKVLNYDCKAIADEYLIIKKSNQLKKRIKYFLRAIVFFKNLYSRKKSFKRFINLNLKLTKLYSKEDILSMNFDNQVFIVGSDQVWNTKHTKGFDDVFLLGMHGNFKKISYAASIGKNTLDKNEIDYFRPRLSEFSHISVREETAKEALEIFMDKKIDVVLDPSFLLSKNEWIDFSGVNDRLVKEPYIFVYMSFDECNKIAEELQRKTGYKIIYIDEKFIFNKNSKNVSWANPYDFINLIMYSEYVVTTSFHASVFSIIFEKKFWIVPPEKVGSRITDLLKKLYIDDRIVYNLNNFKNINYDINIDYSKVNVILNKFRSESQKWLIDAIEK